MLFRLNMLRVAKVNRKKALDSHGKGNFLPSLCSHVSKEACVLGCLSLFVTI